MRGNLSRVDAHDARPTSPGYLSGFCGVGRHDACRGAYAGVTCSCPHHTEPPAELEQPAAPVLTFADISAGHCPTCTCESDA